MLSKMVSKLARWSPYTVACAFMSVCVCVSLFAFEQFSLPLFTCHFSAAGANLLALLASRFLVGHRDRQSYPEEIMTVVADATVGIAGSHRHIECLSESAFDEKHVS